MSLNKKTDKKNIKNIQLPRVLTVFMLLALLVIGLVSTTFASFVADNSTSEDGSLVARVQTAVANRSKEDVANVSAEKDVAETKATVTYTAGEYIYISNFKPSGWSDPWITSSGYAWAHMWGGTAGAQDYLFELYSGTKGAVGAIYRAKVATGGTYTNVIFTRNSTNKGPWTDIWNQTGDIVLSSSNYNCWTGFSAGSTSKTGSHYAVAPSSVSATVTNAVSGSGTNADPYIVRPGASFTIKLTATKADPGMEGFGWNINSSSSKASSGTATTYSKSYTASTTEGTSTYTGYAWCYESSTSYYSSSYKTSNTIYVKVEAQKYTYTVTTATGGTVSPKSGSVVAGNGVSITAEPNTGYTFVEWAGLSKATIGSYTSATTTLTPTDNGATVQAKFRPDTPSALTLTGSNVASGTSGTGTSSNPYIVFADGGFTLTAKATVVSGATPHYSTTSDGTYSTTNTFNPSLTTKGTKCSYNVYAKAYVTGYYSTSYKSATAYYMVFSHLNGANTGFSVSSNSITDADTLTLSGAYVNGVAEAEKAYITQTYQVSTNNSTFSDITGTTWTPDSTGTYYFRVKTTNTKTGETVYSTSQSVTVVQSTVYYDIAVTNKGDFAGAVTLKTDGTVISDNKILSNSPLTLSITRNASTRYFEFVTVSDGTTKWTVNNLNGDVYNELVIDHVKGDVTIEYKILIKPYVQPLVDTNADSMKFEYVSDAVKKTANTQDTYYVDYGSDISYSVTPKSGYYVSKMSDNVVMGPITSSTVTGTHTNVTTNLGIVEATLTNNRTVSVSIDKTNSDVTTGGSMTIDGTALGFGQPKPLNYGATSTIVITPPSGCYAVVSGNNVEATIDTDGKATFEVILEGTNKNYTVKFVNNPKIYMDQPQYGSIYVTSGTGNNTKYYFNGDSVGYGAELILNVKPDHANASIEQIIVNGNNIGTVDGTTFNIYEDSTVTADIFVDSKFAFKDGTEYGTRRIFFTDNASWGEGNVSVHYSTTSGDTNLTTNSKVMTYKYTNDINNGQKVYYADIPFESKYVTFYNKSNTNQKTNSVAISNDNNAFWNDNGTCTAWNLNYSDFVATDRADTIQQGTTVKDEAVTFNYTCDFGDDTLDAEVVDGNAATFDFNKGVLSITPTENSKAFTLVKVTSAASGTVKYYLVRVENFEITDFTGLQKIYSSNVFNDIQLDVIVKGGVLEFAAQLYTSDTNYNGSYNELNDDVKTSGFEYRDSIQSYINSFLIEHAINSMSGVKYYKVQATDGAGHKATKTLKTLFGTNTYNGTRCIYFYNNTGESISKYNLRVCFNDANGNNHRFVTMQRVGNTDYYRAVVPKGYEYSMKFYLTNPKTFSKNYGDYDGSNDTEETYYYATGVQNIPATDDANIVYAATEISDTDGIVGDFAKFDY